MRLTKQELEDITGSSNLGALVDLNLANRHVHDLGYLANLSQLQVGVAENTCCGQRCILTFLGCRTSTWLSMSWRIWWAGSPDAKGSGCSI